MDLDVARPRIVEKKLIYKGFVYVRSKAGRDGKFNWACRKLRRGECSARVVTLQRGDELSVVKESPHTHPADPEEAKAEIVQTTLKRKAEEHPELPPAQILRSELGKLGPEVLSKLPDRSNLKKSLRRRRRRDLPPNPKSLDELGEVPDRFQQTLAGERFFLYDSDTDAEFDVDSGRVLVFGTKKNLELLANSQSWYLDGTFSVCPNIFTQVFTVIGILMKPGRCVNDDYVHVPFPFVYALLSSETSIVCCFFHLGQSLYRRIQSEGLQAAYQDPAVNTIRKYTHMLLAIAIVPLQDVVSTFELLYDNDSVPDDLQSIYDYFDDNYVRGRPRRGRARAVPPRYPIKLWNQYEATLQGLHRTNNISEGWHNRFRLVIGKKHPDLYSCLLEFQKEQRDTEACIVEMNLGKSVKAAPNKKWIAVQERMRRVAAEYETYKNEGRTMEYLETMAYNIQIS